MLSVSVEPETAETVVPATMTLPDTLAPATTVGCLNVSVSVVRVLVNA